MSDNDGQVQRLQAEAYTMRVTIAELREQRDESYSAITQLQQEREKDDTEIDKLKADAQQSFEISTEVMRERDARVTEEEIPYWMRWVRRTEGFWPKQDDAHSALYGVTAWRNSTAPAANGGGDGKQGELLTCGDNSCLLDKPQGQGTNGGCRCINRHMGTAEVIRVKKYIQRLKNTRPTPTADDSAVVEALRAALSDAGRRFAIMGEHGCTNDSIAKIELNRLAARCKAIARSGATMKDQHDAIDLADYCDMAAHDSQQPPAAPVELRNTPAGFRNDMACGLADNEWIECDRERAEQGCRRYRHGGTWGAWVGISVYSTGEALSFEYIYRRRSAPVEDEPRNGGTTNTAHADGLTGDGKIPNTTKKEGE